MSTFGSRPETPLTKEEVEEIVQKIGRDIISATHEDWEEITYEIKSTAMFNTSQKLVKYPGKEVEREDFPSHTTWETGTLRSGMYQPDKGTWFTMKMHIIRPGRYKVEYNYNDPPDFDLPPNPQTYAEEQKRFPRSPKNMPDWYKKELYKAGWYD